MAPLETSSTFTHLDRGDRFVSGPWAWRYQSSRIRAEAYFAERATKQFSQETNDPLPAAPIQHERFSEISELHVKFTQPVSLQALAQLHGLSHLRAEAIHYVASQVKFISYFCSSKHNIILESKPGSGKTYTSLMCADHYLSKDDAQVIVITPLSHLTDQFKRDTRIVLDLPEEAFLKATGEMSPEARTKRYNDGKTKLIYATPETILNDLLSGNLSLEKVRCIIFDEEHRMLGNSDYARLGRMLKDLNEQETDSEKRIRILAQSATPDVADAAEKEIRPEEILERLSQFGAEDYVRLSIPANTCYSSIESPVELTGHHQAARLKLWEVMADVTRHLGFNILKLADTYAAAGTPFGPLEEFIVSLGNCCSRGGKESLRRFYHARRGLFYSKAEGEKPAPQPKEKKRPFKLLTSGEFKELEQQLLELSRNRKNEWFRDAHDLLSTLGSLRSLDNHLATVGLHAFLSKTAGYYAKIHFPDHPKPKRRNRKNPLPRTDSKKKPEHAEPWRKELYSRKDFKDAIELAAKQTCYQDFFKQGSWRDVGLNLLDAVPGEDLDPAALRQLFESLAFTEMARRAEPNHPVENSLFSWITGDPRVTGGQGVHIRVKTAAHAKFLAERLEYMFSSGIKAVSVSVLLGKKHMNENTRNENLTDYASGKCDILICTSTGDLGLDVKRTRLVLCLATPDDPNSVAQLKGRAGRRMDLRRFGLESGGSFIILPTKDTEDEHRAYSTRNELEKDEREREQIGDLFGGSL